MPARKPRSLKILHGTYRAAEQPVKKVKTSKLPTKPRGLDSVATTHWKHVTKTRRDWLSESDGPALEQLCKTWSMMHTIGDQLKNKPGDYRTMCIFQGLNKQWLAQAKEFGLTPQSREKLGVVEADASRSELEAKYLG